jgi:rhodanese-related sulfurtransferase
MGTPWIVPRTSVDVPRRGLVLVRLTSRLDEGDHVHREIDPIGADEAVSQGALLLDVREPEEFAAGHAPGALLVPVGELAARVDELPDDTVIICVCRSGVRSATAADLLVAQGREAANLVGGMLAWSSEGLVVTTTAGGAGAVI